MKTKFDLQLFAEEVGQVAAESGQGESAAAPDTAPDTAPAAAPQRMSWDEIRQDPEYSARIRQLINTRMRGSAAEKNLAALEPALRQLAKSHNLDAENLNYAALARAITQGYAAYEGRTGALQNLCQNHIAALERQAAAIPNFNLRRALQDKRFAQLTSPMVGLSVSDAHYLLNREAVRRQDMRYAARDAARRIANSIRSGTARPVENGTTARSASVSTFDYAKASPAQKASLKQAIREAAARGEKLYPGQWGGGR